jgi:DNA repair exonuclease SbcCD nuclease subunit
LAELRRLEAAGVPTVLLSGNHDSPRLRETGHIFRIFEGMRHVRPVYKGGCEKVTIATDTGPVVVHAVPQAVTQEAFQDDLAGLRPEADVRNVLTVHGTVAGVDGLFTSELNDLLIPQNALDPGFDYVALGHFHGHRRVADNAYYAGSTERTSIREAGQEKTFSEVDLEPAGLGIRLHPTKARPMVDVGPMAAGAADAGELAALLRERIRTALEPGCVMRLTVTGVDRAMLRALDLDLVRDAAAPALHFMFRPQVVETDAEVQLPPSLGHLDDELGAFLAKFPLEGFDRATVETAARRLVAASQEEPDAP